METELEILKKIQENKGKPTPVRLISIQTGFGPDYLRYICKNLLRKNLVNCQGRDCYLINRRGEKELKRRGLIKAKRSSPSTGLSLTRLAQWRSREIKVGAIPIISDIIKKTPDSFKPREEKLNFGKKVEKAVSFLKKLRLRNE